jgi:hypothetical protein
MVYLRARWEWEIFSQTPLLGQNTLTSCEKSGLETWLGIYNY